ncbi:fimbrial protein [Citrobacter portucalensis]|uniref:fimbrial protein n=1 Tax=Citrobacter portucalensis TaxID=1639133 RepID=UPI003EE2474F
MKLTPALLALSVSAVLFSGVASSAVISGTTSAKMKFTSTVVTGTCTAKVVDSSGASTAEIKYGDIYRSDIGKSTVPLSIQLSNCSGVTSATVAAKPGSGGKCSGKSYDGGLKTAFEIWSGAVDTGVQLSCTTPPAAQVVTISNGSGQYPMQSRIVAAEGQTAATVEMGNVSAPVTFVVTYP